MTITPRSLFNVVLKIFGLFFLREIINEVLATISIFVRYFSMGDFEISIGVLIVSLLILCFYVMLAVQLLFRTNFIIDALKLDSGFSEHEFSLETKNEYKIALSTSEILTISLIILGGYILVDEIPDFCKQVYLFINEKKSNYNVTAPSIANTLASGAKIIVALLILGERKRIIDFIQGKKSEEYNENV